MAEQVNGYRRFGWVDMLRFYQMRTKLKEPDLIETIETK